MKLKNQKGQSMYEMVIAIAIVALSLLAFVGLIISSLSAANYTREKSRANSYVQQALEWLRTEKDADWGAFYTNASGNTGGMCLGSLTWSGGCGISGTNYERRAYFTVSSGDKVNVRIEVSWSDARGRHVSEGSTSFTDWRSN